MGLGHITISAEKESRNQYENTTHFTALELPSEPGKDTEMQAHRDRHGRLKM